MIEVCYNFPQMIKANTSIVHKEDKTIFFHTISNAFYKLGGSMIFETFVTVVDSFHHNVSCKILPTV
jgi:hypothetical protein